jgi:exodeoxyribonuclease-5
LAGTGKTTLVCAIGGVVDSVAFASPTGKGAAGLRAKGGSDATTLHRLLFYSPEIKTDDRGRSGLTWFRRSETLDAKLVIADECSMIDKELGRALIATKRKILVTGDPMQLPAINGRGYFDRKPDHVLEEIHRMAADSQPLAVATAIRAGEKPKAVPYDRQAILEADIVICGFNQTRRTINKHWRQAHRAPDRFPVVGDTIMCYRTNYSAGVLNGELWVVESVAEAGDNLRLELVDDLDNEASVLVPENDFASGPQPGLQRDDHLDSFDFGYAITCHKAQGSEWRRVIVIDETAHHAFPYMAKDSNLALAEFQRRWLYTAVTRASHLVTLMKPPP